MKYDIRLIYLDMLKDNMSARVEALSEGAFIIATTDWDKGISSNYILRPHE